MDYWGGRGGEAKSADHVTTGGERGRRGEGKGEREKRKIPLIVAILQP